jgi:hypothetical protein
MNYFLIMHFVERGELPITNSAITKPSYSFNNLHVLISFRSIPSFLKSINDTEYFCGVKGRMQGSLESWKGHYVHDVLC